jgi:hypothetical protein
MPAFKEYEDSQMGREEKTKRQLGRWAVRKRERQTYIIIAIRLAANTLSLTAATERSLQGTTEAQ